MELSGFVPAYSTIDDEALRLFRQYLCKHSGIEIPPEKAYLFETRLSKMMADAGFDNFGQFYRYVISDKDPGIKQKIVDAMMTNETLWFRDESPWKVLEERMLPGLVKALQTGQRQRLRIWFAGVSTGQEAYSTVMCVDNYLKTHDVRDVGLEQFDFFATDISGRVLEIAKRGRYDAISIRRGLGDHYRERYFTQNHSAWDLAPRIRDAVRFVRFNLQEDYGGFGCFDIIFCRYVLIYFPDTLKQEVIAKMYHALADEGVLFTGISALYDQIGSRFNRNHYSNLTYYTKKVVGT